jgi:hypothetical protein
VSQNLEFKVDLVTDSQAINNEAILITEEHGKNHEGQERITKESSILRHIKGIPFEVAKYIVEICKENNLPGDYAIMCPATREIIYEKSSGENCPVKNYLSPLKVKLLAKEEYV